MLKTPPREASNKDTKPQRTTGKARNATKLEANLDNMEGWSQKKGTPNCNLRNKVLSIAIH